MTDDLVTWLREQIAEDRAAALACAGAPWVDDVTAMVHVDPMAIREDKWGLGHLGFVASADNSAIGDAYRAHIVRHDPRAALAQCEAHTAILDAYRGAIRRRVAEGRNYGRWVDGEPERRYPAKIMAGPDDRAIPGLELAVKLVALAYQHRPGYREEWTP